MTKRLRAKAAEELGQVLAITTLMLVPVIFGMAVLAVDAGGWFVSHRQAQTAADAAALAQANYCTAGGCTSSSTGQATDMCQSNGVSNASDCNVSVDTSAATVTVKTTTHPSSFFAKLFNVLSTPSATATATWDGNTGIYSLFAYNSQCGTGLGLQGASNGGGNESITGMHGNGEFIWNADSNHPVYGSYSSAQAGGTACPDNSWNSKQDGNINSSGTSALPYPVTFSQPGTGGGPPCTYSEPWFSTSATGVNAISSPGVYCATGTPSSCPDFNGSKTSPSAGDIYVGTALTGNFEFVGPCITLATTGTINSPAGAPLVYGTATAGPTSPTPDIWIDGNNETFVAPIYDPNGTVKITGNNGTLTGFIEAMNITVDKNSFTAFTGNGPQTAPGGDQLVG